MNKTSSIPLIFIFISFAYSLTHLFIINQITAQTFLDVLQLFYSIFFFIFLFGIAKHYHFFELIGHILYPFIHPILKLNKTEIGIYVSSIFAGYPTYSKLIKDANLPQERTLYLLRFCSHPSIGFTVTTLGLTLYQNLRIGYLLFFIQIISNFIIAFLYRFESSSIEFYKKNNSNNLIDLFKQQFKSTFEIFIYIFGYMLVFRIISSMIPIHNSVILGFFEFSQGCLSLINYNKQLSFILATTFLSFSSLSVIFQTLGILNNVVTLKTLLVYRFQQAAISTLLASFISFIIF